MLSSKNTLVSENEDKIHKLEREVKEWREKYEKSERRSSKIALKNEFLLQKCDEFERESLKAMGKANNLLKENDRVGFLNKLLNVKVKSLIKSKKSMKIKMAELEEENEKHKADAQNLRRENHRIKNECGKIKVSLFNLKEVISAVNEKQEVFDVKLKTFTMCSNENLMRENKNLKKQVENMKEGNVKNRLVAEKLKEENERYDKECSRIKVVVENLQLNISTNNKEKIVFGKLVKKLEFENDRLKKLLEDNESTKLTLQEQIAKQDESFQLILKENEVFKNKIEKKNKRKFKLFCI